MIKWLRLGVKDVVNPKLLNNRAALIGFGMVH